MYMHMFQVNHTKEFHGEQYHYHHGPLAKELLWW